jgi:serine/threonine protein phosphatase PrpC
MDMIILASDGVFDKLANREVAGYALNALDPYNARLD